MEISYAFFAEAAQITSDGRLNLLGADFPILPLQGQPPWTVGPISLVVSIQMEREDCGRLYHITADLTAPDGSAIKPHVENDFVAPVPEQPDMMVRMKIVLELNGITFPAPGLYHMHVRVEDRERNIAQERQVRLRVAEAGQHNPPAQENSRVSQERQGMR